MLLIHAWGQQGQGPSQVNPDEHRSSSEGLMWTSLVLGRALGVNDLAASLWMLPLTCKDSQGRAVWLSFKRMWGNREVIGITLGAWVLCQPWAHHFWSLCQP